MFIEEDFLIIKAGDLSNLTIPVLDEYNRSEMESLAALQIGPAYPLPEPQLVSHYPGLNDTGSFNNTNLVTNFVNTPTFDGMYIGKIYPTLSDVMEDVQACAISLRFEYVWEIVTYDRVVVICSKSKMKCRWGVEFNYVPHLRRWTVKDIFTTHTCTPIIMNGGNMHLTKEFIGREVLCLVQEKYSLTPGQIKDLITKKFRYNVHYVLAWQSRQWAIDTAFGDWEESLIKVPNFLRAMNKANTEHITFCNTTKISRTSETVDRVFWSFEAAVNGFAHCRPVICVDSAPMIGNCEATLMIAVAVDGENNLLPLAYGYVESENESSWIWFLACLWVAASGREGVCLVTTNEVAQIAARIHEWSPPRGHNRNCVRRGLFDLQTHDEISPEFAKIFGQATHQHSREKCDYYLNKLMTSVVDPTVASWIQNLNIGAWTQAYDDKGRRWGIMTTNVQEIFNYFLRGVRDLPVCALINFTHDRSKTYWAARVAELNDCDTPLAPQVNRAIRKNAQLAKDYIVSKPDPFLGVYNVRNYNAAVSAVNIDEMTCSCGKWQSLHYPCSHALAVLKASGRRMKDFIASEYLTKSCKLAWSYVFHELPEEENWDCNQPPYYIPNGWFEHRISP